VKEFQGASKGIGKATARLLASNNMNVVVNYFQDSEAVDNTIQEIERLGGTALTPYICII